MLRWVAEMVILTPTFPLQSLIFELTLLKSKNDPYISTPVTKFTLNYLKMNSSC